MNRLHGMRCRYSLVSGAGAACVGGFTNLSGLQVGELAGQNYGMVTGGFRYYVAGSGLFPAYLGGTLEYGQMADDTADLIDDGILNGSLYFAYRSPIGPLYVGAGLAEGGRRTYSIRIGNVFGNSDIVQ
jgi:NTE family protein